MSSFKEFKPTSWAIDNRITVFILTVIITLAGLSVYNTIPKEQFPDVVLPTIYVQTVYVGNSPKDIENLVTRPIEKELKGITGVKINKIPGHSLPQHFRKVRSTNIRETKYRRAGFDLASVYNCWILVVPKGNIKHTFAVNSIQAIKTKAI